MMENLRGYCCSRWREGCNTTIWKEFFGCEISAQEAKSLLEGKEIGPVELISKDGSPYQGILYFEKEAGRVYRKFPPKGEHEEYPF
jgi:DNA topoisomerase-3